MVKVKEIYDYIDSFAPFATQMDFDNAGLLVGSMEAQTDRVLLALDVTGAVVREARRKKCRLVVTHHPLIFHPLRSVNPDHPTEGVVAGLVEGKIALISAHTNLDLAPGGVNDVLMGRLGAKTTGVLEPMADDLGLGRVGELPQAMTPRAFAAMVKKALGTRAVRAVAGDRPVKKIAVCSGSGGDMVALAAKAGADAYVTADVKHHEFLEAAARGLTLLDAGHYATENLVMPELCQRLQEAFAGREVAFLLSAANKEPYFAP